MVKKTRFLNNANLQTMLRQSGFSGESLKPFFLLDASTHEELTEELIAQHPEENDPRSRAAFREITAAPPREETMKIRTLHNREWYLTWAWRIIIFFLLSFLATRAHAQQPSGNPGPSGGGGLIVQWQNGGTILLTRPAGILIVNCSTGMSCSSSGSTVTLTSTGGGGTGCIPPGSVANALLYDPGAGVCADITKFTSNGTTTITGLATSILDLTLSTVLKIPVSAGCATAANGQICYDTTSAQGKLWQNGADRFLVTTSVAGSTDGQIPIYNASLKTFVPGDPLVQGLTAHDAVATSTNPVLIGGYASAAAPADVSNDGDATRLWVLRNGSPVFNLASGGTLVTLGQKTMSASLPVVLPSDQTIASQVATVSASGTLGALNATVAVSIEGRNGAAVAITSGTLTGTVTPEVSYDGGTTWRATNLLRVGPALTNILSGLVNPASGGQDGFIIPPGVTNARVRVSAYTSGSVGATMRAVIAQPTPMPLVYDWATGNAQLLYQNSANGALRSATCDGALNDRCANVDANSNLNVAVADLPLAQGSTTSGQKGVLMQGAVTTSAPSYTNAQTSPVSLDTSGNVRITCTTCGITDNSAFTVGTTGGNVMMAYYTSGAAPTITSGNVGRLTMNASSALIISCPDGTCTGGGGGGGVTQVKDASNVSTNVGYFTGNLNLPVQDAATGAPGSAFNSWYMNIGGSDYLGLGRNRVARVDSFGNQYVIADENQTRLAGVLLGQPSMYGTGPGFVKVQGVNAFITNTPSVNMTQVAGVPMFGQVAGSIPVTIVSGAGSGGTASADAATFTPGATNGTLSNCFFQTTSANNALTNLQGGSVQCTARRAPFVNIDAISGTAPTTPGFLDVKGADGNMFVRQTTGTNLHMVSDSGSVTSASIPTWAGGTLGAMANYGTSPGAVLVPGVNAFITNTVPVTLTSTTITGTVAVTQSTSPWVASCTSANCSMNVGQFGGTNVSTGTGASGAGIPRVTVSNDSNILATQSGTWNIGTLTTITNPVTVAQATAANLNATVVGTGTFQIQCSSGCAGGSLSNNNAAPTNNNGGVLAALANAFAPTYTEGNQVLLSVDLTGALRVSGASGGGVAQNQVRSTTNAWTDVGYFAGDLNLPVQSVSEGAIGGAMPLWGTLFAGTDITGKLQDIQTDTFGNLKADPQLVAAVQSQRVRGGIFSRPITSTGDALDVNVKFGNPCDGPNIRSVNISQTTNTRVILGEGTGSLCGGLIVGADAENVSILAGSGSTCASTQVALIGGVTAALGPNMSANGGFSFAFRVPFPAYDICVFQSGAGRVAGVLSYAFNPR